MPAGEGLIQHLMGDIPDDVDLDVVYHSPIPVIRQMSICKVLLAPVR